MKPTKLFVQPDTPCPHASCLNHTNPMAVFVLGVVVGTWTLLELVTAQDPPVLCVPEAINATKSPGLLLTSTPDGDGGWHWLQSDLEAT